MRPIFGCSVVTLVMLSGTAVSTVSLAASKPDGGYCECGQYLEVPVLCRSLTGSDLDACRKSNTQWFDQCLAWQDQTCRVSSPVAKSTEPSAISSQELSPEALPPLQFVGSWSGETKCRVGTMPLTLTVTRKPDGSYAVSGTARGLGFSRETFQGDSVTLVYVSVMDEVTYSGRLVSPDRIEGTISTNSNCTWYMTK
ncbi:MAG: hypothetical protein WCA78_12615 [Rhizomicrobium sp.]